MVVAPAREADSLDFVDDAPRLCVPAEKRKTGAARLDSDAAVGTKEKEVNSFWRFAAGDFVGGGAPAVANENEGKETPVAIDLFSLASRSPPTKDETKGDCCDGEIVMLDCDTASVKFVLEDEKSKAGEKTFKVACDDAPDAAEAAAADDEFVVSEAKENNCCAGVFVEVTPKHGHGLGAPRVTVAFFISERFKFIILPVDVEHSFDEDCRLDNDVLSSSLPHFSWSDILPANIKLF